MKRLIVTLFTLVMSASLLSGCNKSKEESTTEVSATPTTTVQAEHPTDPMEMITDGYYTYSFSVEGYGQFDNYFHFYKEAPVVGAVFYAGFATNQVTFAGTYTVEKKDYAYKCCC